MARKGLSPEIIELTPRFRPEQTFPQEGLLVECLASACRQKSGLCSEQVQTGPGLGGVPSEQV